MGHLRVAQLGALRLSSVTLMLAQNILLVRFVPLNQLGMYYVIGTIAYLGNAVFFVGADLNLQQRLANLSVDRTISGKGLFRYLLATAAPGAALVLLSAALYFFLRDSSSWASTSLLCVCLSVATYASSVGRNLCQLAMLQTYASLGPIVDGSVRCLFIAALVHVDSASALTLAASSAIGSLCAASATIALLLSRCSGGFDSYLGRVGPFIRKVSQVGSSGLANWAQLQGYRPVIASSPAGEQVVGTISFMTTLGSTAASAVFTVLALFQMPRQYSSRGATTGAYVRLVGATAIVLSLLSVPAGLLFLEITHRGELFGLLYLIVVGVAIESGNVILGICANHLNVRERSLAPLSKAGILGCVVTFGLLCLPSAGADEFFKLALTLLSGQVFAVALVLYMTFRHADTTHAE